MTTRAAFEKSEFGNKSTKMKNNFYWHSNTAILVGYTQQKMEMLVDALNMKIVITWSAFHEVCIYINMNNDYFFT